VLLFGLCLPRPDVFTNSQAAAQRLQLTTRLRPVNPKIYGDIVLDQRISAGAYRLWGYLAFRAGEKGFCWPSIRTILRELRCHHGSLKEWFEQLKTSGYLKIVVTNKSRTYYPFEGYPPVEKVTTGVWRKGVQGVEKVTTKCGESDPRTNERTSKRTKGVAPAAQNGWLDGAPPKSDPALAAKALSDLQALKDTLKEDPVVYKTSVQL
jgi:hypothetical protein